MGTMMPSIFLSGYVFPRETMPTVFQWISYLVPATYFVDIARGIILRGAGFSALWPHVAALLVIALVLVASSTQAFRKTIR